MSSLTISKHIAAPVDRVFAVFTDVANMAEHIDGIERVEMLSDGPVGVGTRFRETRIMFKREATEELEFTAFKPNASYEVGCESCGCSYNTTFTFTPAGDGTDVTLDLQCRPLTFMAKLMSPIGILFAGTMKKCMDGDMSCLKAVAESA